MSEFVLASMVIFGLLFAVWSKETWYNLLLKIVLMVMMIWGILLHFGVTT